MKYTITKTDNYLTFSLGRNRCENMMAVRDRVSELVQEVCNGDYKIDKLPNAAYDLRDERQAAYFSHARENMKTDIAHIIMYANQQIYD